MPTEETTGKGAAADRPGFDEEVERLAALADGVRRSLYRFVVDQGRPVGRDEAAAGAGVARHVAKFHLDRLVEEGLLDAEFRRLTDRTGPGAGRPAKLYRRSARELSVSLPERHYELAGMLLAEAVTRAEARGTAVAAELAAAAAAAGRRLGAERRAGGDDFGSSDAPAVLQTVLRTCGYEPVARDGEIELRNCPFHCLADAYPGLVCGMNLDFLVGLVEGLGVGRSPRLDPGAGRCCVTVGA